MLDPETAKRGIYTRPDETRYAGLVLKHSEDMCDQQYYATQVRSPIVCLHEDEKTI